MDIQWVRNKDVMIAENILSTQDIERILNFLGARAEWARAGVYNSRSKDQKELIDEVRTCENIYITKQVFAGNADFIPLDKEIEKIVFNAMSEYIKEHPQLVINADEGYEVIRYQVGQEFKLHIDFSKHMPHTRQVSVCLYLNDDYEGGELNFPTLDLKIKPKAGSVVLFPSNYVYMHQSMPIVKGTKHSIVTWFN